MTSRKNLARERGDKYNLQILCFDLPLVSMIFYHQIKLKKKEERKKKERKKKTKGVELCISILSVRDILKI